MMNKTITTFLATISIVASAPASAIMEGGVNFGENPTNIHLETATLAQTFLYGNGQDATAYGFISTVNGDNTYCSDGSSNCGLYYVANFHDSQNLSSSYAEFSSATVSIFYSNRSPINLLGQDSPTNIATIQALNGGNPWVTLTGHGNLGGISAPNAVVNGVYFLTGSSLGGAYSGLFDVTGPGNASVISFLNSNNVVDAVGGLTDIVFTSSFNNHVLNPLDITNGLAAGCLDGTAAAGNWCFQGTANLRGSTAVVPEPETYAMFLGGLGILGWRLRKTKANQAPLSVPLGCHSL